METTKSPIQQMFDWLRSEQDRYQTLREKAQADGDKERAEQCLHHKVSMSRSVDQALKLGAVVEYNSSLATEAEILIPKTGCFAGHELTRNLRIYETVTKEKNYSSMLIFEKLLQQWVVKARLEMAKQSI